MNSRDPETQLTPLGLAYDIVDIHAHFFPPGWFEAIWEFFEKHSWTITYKGTSPDLARQLCGFGVSHFTILNYLHKPGIRDSLAQWTRDFAALQPNAIPFGTLYPGEPGNLDAARRWFSDWGFAGLKIQPLVSKKYVPDPVMYPVFELMAEMGRWLLIHIGTAPYPNQFTNLNDLERLLEDVPGLPTILAHMGGFDFEHALELLERFPNLYLDTTMIFVNAGVFDASYPLPPERLEPFLDRILFGSDFPNIPYDYHESVAGLRRYGFEGKNLHRILRGNAMRLFGLDAKAADIQKP